MKPIIDLEIALLNSDKPGVRAVIDYMDLRTQNVCFLRAAEHFGFKTVQAYGKRVANRADLARVFGYKDESGIRKLAERYELEAHSMAAYAQNVRRLLATELDLHKFTNKLVLVGWETFLVAGMAATNPAAEVVKLYLLEAERAARIAGGTLDIIDSDKHRIDRMSKVVAMVCKADRLKDQALRLKVLGCVDEVLEGVLAIPKQGDFFSAKPAQQASLLDDKSGEKS